MRSRLGVKATISCLTSAALLSGAALAAPPGAAAAAQAPASRSGHLRGSRPGSLRGELAARGWVTGADGRAIAGARVLLYAWPRSSVLMKLRPGQRVPVRQAGAATTARSGRYAIRISSPAALRSTAARDGTVNLEVVSVASAGVDSFSFHRRLPRAIRAPAVDLQLANPARGTVRRAVPCGWAFIKSYGPRWTVVGTTYARTSRVTQHFSYHKEQSSSLGVGQSTSNEAGSFSEAGTDSASSTTREDYPTHDGNTGVRYKTKFIYGLYGFSCGSGFISYQARPTGYAGGARYRKFSKNRAPAANFCVAQKHGTTFHKDNSSAYEFTAGLDISVIGLTLSAQTGYASGAEITFHFKSSRKMCGTGDYPGGTPKLLVARR